MPMDMYGNEPEISGPQKAAILLISLGPEYSAMLFKHLTDEEIEKLTLEIANQKQVEPELKQSVISEFYQMAMDKSYLSSGGLHGMFWKKHWAARRLPLLSAVSLQVCRYVLSISCTRQIHPSF